MGTLQLNLSLDLHKILLFINCFPNKSCCLSVGFVEFRAYATQLAPDGKYTLEIGWFFKCSPL